MVAEAEWVNMSINHLTNSQGRGFNVYNVNDSKKHCLNSKYDHELGREEVTISGCNSGSTQFKSRHQLQIIQLIKFSVNLAFIL